MPFPIGTAAKIINPLEACSFKLEKPIYVFLFSQRFGVLVHELDEGINKTLIRPSGTNLSNLNQPTQWNILQVLSMPIPKLKKKQIKWYRV